MNKGFGLIQVLVALAIFFLIALFITLYYTAGATPKILTIDGPETLVEGQTGEYKVTVVLDGKPSNPREFEIRIDEDDTFPYDDTLDELAVIVAGGKDTKSEPFDLTCKNLTVSGGKFDLEGTKDTSEDEAIHHVHAEYYRGTLAFALTSKENVKITCVKSEEELEGPSDDGNQ